MAEARNPLIERYYSPLGVDPDGRQLMEEIRDAREKAIQNIQAKLEAAKDEDERRQLRAELRSLKSDAR